MPIVPDSGISASMPFTTCLAFTLGMKQRRASYVIPAGSVFVEPGIGVEYQSRDYVDYYYGVTEAEARSRVLPMHPQGPLTRNQYCLFTRSLGGGTTRLQLTHTTYGKEISNSPLTDAEQSLGVFPIRSNVEGQQQQRRYFWRIVQETDCFRHVLVLAVPLHCLSKSDETQTLRSAHENCWLRSTQLRCRNGSVSL